MLVSNLAQKAEFSNLKNFHLLEESQMIVKFMKCALVVFLFQLVGMMMVLLLQIEL